MQRLLFSILLAATSWSAYAQFPWDLLKDPSFRASYFEALGPKRSEKWLAQLPGPSEMAARQVVDDTEYLVIHSCKPHACDTHNLVLVFAPKKRQVFGKLVEAGVTTKLGTPPPLVQVLIEDAYAKRFSSKS